MLFFFNDTATTEIYTVLTHSFPTRRSSDLHRRLDGGAPRARYLVCPRARLARPARLRRVRTARDAPADRRCHHHPPTAAHRWRARRQPRRGAGDRSARRRDPARIRSLKDRSEEHTSELQSLMRISYDVFCLKKKKKKKENK